MRSAWWLALLLATVTGCSHGEKAKSVDDDIADPNCRFVKTSANDDPEKLVQEYLDRETHGTLFGKSDWFPQAAMCPGGELKPERYAVVTSYSYKVVSSSSTAAEYVVDYVGKGGIKFNSESRKWEWDFFRVKPDPHHLNLVKTAYGWRIVRPAVTEDSYLVPEAAKIMSGGKLKKYFKKYGPSDK